MIISCRKAVILHMISAANTAILPLSKFFFDMIPSYLRNNANVDGIPHKTHCILIALSYQFSFRIRFVLNFDCSPQFLLIFNFNIYGAPYNHHIIVKDIRGNSQVYIIPDFQKHVIFDLKQSLI